MNRSRRHALWLAGGMVSAALLAAWARPRPRSRADVSAIDLRRIFPTRFGDWREDEVSKAFVSAVDRQGQRYRFYDQLLERTFIDSQGRRMMLSVAFGSEQSSALQLHRPEVCYRASGYLVSGAHAASIPIDGRAMPVTRLHAQRPDRSEPLTYWTVLGGKVVDDQASFRWRRLAFALRRELPDGLLVRISSIDADAPRAYAAQQAFALELTAAIAQADRPAVIGTGTA